MGCTRISLVFFILKIKLRSRFNAIQCIERATPRFHTVIKENWNFTDVLRSIADFAEPSADIGRATWLHIHIIPEHFTHTVHIMTHAFMKTTCCSIWNSLVDWTERMIFFLLFDFTPVVSFNRVNSLPGRDVIWNSDDEVKSVSPWQIPLSNFVRIQWTRSRKSFSKIVTVYHRKLRL